MKCSLHFENIYDSENYPLTV